MGRGEGKDAEEKVKDGRKRLIRTNRRGMEREKLMKRGRRRRNGEERKKM